MEFRDSPQEAEFRQQVRQFIRQNLPEGFGTPEYAERNNMDDGEGFNPRHPVIQQWRDALGKQGWIAPHWPKEYGGAGMSVSEQFVFNEELAAHRAPTNVGGMGVSHIGPILILYGTDEQKQQHLSRVTRGETWWCQGYSEPGSGSDLASLQTRAVRDGDDFVINGQKIWTSGAHHADWMFILTRTDPDAPKHRGISMFLLDMKTPGIQISPLINMAGDHGFNQVFFDNVRVPATNMVGEQNRGWYVGAALLDFERSNISGTVQLVNTIADLIQYAKEHKVYGESVRAELADRVIEGEVARLMAYRIVTMQKRGQIPNYEASVSKNFRSETSQRVARTGMKVIGMYGLLRKEPKWAPLNGRLSHMYLSSVPATIAAGTSEINRNVIATRGLGLPRG